MATIHLKDDKGKREKRYIDKAAMHRIVERKDSELKSLQLIVQGEQLVNYKLSQQLKKAQKDLQALASAVILLLSLVLCLVLMVVTNGN